MRTNYARTLSVVIAMGAPKSVNRKSSLIQLVYVSAATVSFTEEMLDELLEKTRAHNKSISVTGVLLYTNGTFFQVLEGDLNAVQTIYEKIKRDTRHDNVLVIATRNVEERQFGDWSMGFMRERSEIGELPGFVNFFSTSRRYFLDLNGDTKRIGQILEGFRRGRWRRQAISA